MKYIIIIIAILIALFSCEKENEKTTANSSDTISLKETFLSKSYASGVNI